MRMPQRFLNRHQDAGIIGCPSKKYKVIMKKNPKDYLSVEQTDCLKYLL
jgi:hypothetical protein